MEIIYSRSILFDSIQSNLVKIVPKLCPVQRLPASTCRMPGPQRFHEVVKEPPWQAARIGAAADVVLCKPVQGITCASWLHTVCVCVCVCVPPRPQCVPHGDPCSPGSHFALPCLSPSLPQVASACQPQTLPPILAASHSPLLWRGAISPPPLEGGVPGCTLSLLTR